ncbi:MAG: universal stress protein [Candidatus Limnocylindrales bacterium]
MTVQTRVLVAVAGAETGPFWDRVRQLVPPDMAIELVHVIDEAPVQEIGMQFYRRPGHPRPPDLEARAQQAAALGTEAILARAQDGLGRPASTFVERGRPEQVIVARAWDVGASLVVVGARPGDLHTPAEPHSLGHVSRFVVDHAPCPVLLVRV